MDEQSEENLKALNDLNEENQSSFNEIYIALSEMAKKQNEVEKISKTPRRLIGFRKKED